MDPLWIDEGPQLERFCRQIGDGPVAVDTESDHFHAYQARVCLIQLAVGPRQALVDPLALDEEDLAPLFDIFEDPDVVKILHAARNDIIELDRDYGVSLCNIFDTQIAARFLDCDRNSLDWMLEHLLGVETGAAFKRFDWTTRPIPADARQYAVDDVRYLQELRERFAPKLRKVQWWEAFSQQCDFVAQSVEYEAKQFDPNRWRRIKGSSKLDGPGRAALLALYLWRHELCTKLNRSAVTIFPNAVMLRLARQRPVTAGEVADTKGIPKRLVNNHAEAIGKVIAGSSITKPPARKPVKRACKPSPPEQKRRYNALRTWRNERAKEYGIPSEFIATNATLTEIAASPPTSIDELREFQAILPWQADVLGDEILELIEHK